MDQLAQHTPNWPLSSSSQAAYLDISVGTFDKWVAEGKLPEPYRHNGIALWDSVELDAAIMDLREPTSVEDDTGGW